MSNRTLDNVSKSVEDVTDSYTIQAEEDRLKRQRKFRVEVYFDTFDVVHMIQGIWGIQSGSYNLRPFNNDSTLVHSLAFEGWLGTINMLPPHQDEFVNKLKQHHTFPERTNQISGDWEEDLLYELPLEIFKNKKSEPELFLKNYYKNLKVDAELLFKANYVMKIPFWIDRLKYLEKKGFLNIDNESYKFVDLVKETLFKDINKELNELRPKKRRSNIVDALALCLLQKKIIEFETSEWTKPLPVFYASSRAIFSAINILRRENSKLFSYKLHNKRVPIVRNYGFFVLDSIFKLEDQGDIFDGFVKMLQQFKEELKVDYKTNQILKATFDDKKYQNFQTDLDEKIKVEFFNKIWFKGYGYKNLSESILTFIEYKNNDKTVKSQIQKERKNLTKRLKQEVHEFDLFIKIWHDLSSLYDDAIFSENIDFDNLNVFTDFGFTRFCFNETIGTKIQNETYLLFKLRKQEETIQFNQKIITIIVDCTEYILNKDKEAHYESLMVGLAILWIFRKYDVIVKICDTFKLDYGNNYQLAIMHAAAIHLHENDKKQIASSIADCIEKKNQKTKPYQVLIGLSYINYQIWNIGLSNPPLQELIKNKKIKKKSRSTYFIGLSEKAVKYIEAALKDLEDCKDDEPTKILSRNRRYYYAMNNYVFYVTKCGSSEKFGTLNEWIELLKRCLQRKEYWQNRFHDTIAWYYLRKALISSERGNSNKKVITFLEIAKKWSKQAVQELKTPLERDISRNLKERIDIYLAEYEDD